VLLAVAGGCTSGATVSNPTPGAITADVVMREMSFTPSRFTFHVGDTVTFHFENKGKLPHEAVLGDQEAQTAAVAAMQAMDAASSTTTSLPPARGASRIVLGSHQAGASVGAAQHPGMGLPNVIYLLPGAVGDITFQFAKPTAMLMECHQPGHLEAGMKAYVVIKQ
jgi:uncharacterized cupredoxin-like copper-binding protein